MVLVNRNWVVMAEARLAECARPRAQQAPKSPTRSVSLQLGYFPTLLRPRTGALRQGILPPLLTHYSEPTFHN